MKVLHVIWQPEFGGIEKLVLDLLPIQNRIGGVEANVMCGISDGRLRPQFERLPVRCFFQNFKHGYDLSPVKVGAARRAMASHDIVHLHGFNLSIAAACFRLKSKIVYTEHGNFGLGRRARMGDRIKQPLSRLFIRYKVTHLTFNSEFTRQIWERRIGVNVRRTVVPNGIAFDAPSEDHNDGLIEGVGNAFIVGTTSRFAGFKRIDRLIRAFAQFQTGRDAKLVLVGDGPLRSEFEALAVDLGIREKVIFTGFRKAVRQCQDQMQVCVFPSQSEPFGLVAVEALSCGRPTVVFADGGGMVDIVKPLCAQDVVNDEGSLAQRLAYYYDHRDQLESSRQARINHARRYDIRTMAERFQEIYTQVTASDATCAADRLALA